MIQRKQTIWLLLAALSILLSFFFPFGIHTASTLETTTITETDLNAKTNMVVMILSILSAAFSFFLIFLYGNRKLQMKLCLLGVLIAVGILGFELFTAFQTSEGNKFAFGVFGSKLYIGIIVPVLTMFFLMLGYNGIKQDEKLIRDSDRLR